MLDGRGTNPGGQEDEHPKHAHVDLPPPDPNYVPPDLGPRLAKLIHDDAKPRRTQTLFPYLFIRAAAGDRGARPLWHPIPCWESCDIHLLPVGAGDFDFTRTVMNPVAGQSYRVFVHVWNLGRMAAYGARLRAWWVEPGFFGGTPSAAYQPHFIGGTWLDLGDRDSGQAHRLVEIPTPWTVVMNNEAHECLLAAVEVATDPWDGVLDANHRRHVAQRNLNLVAGPASARSLIERLAEALPKRFTTLEVSVTGVGQADLRGAHERGLSAKAEGRATLGTGGIVPGPATAPVLQVTWSKAGLTAAVGDGGLRGGLAGPGVAGPFARAGGRLGAAAGGPIGRLVPHPAGVTPKDLPELVQRALGAADLTGTEVAAAFGGPALVRFALTQPGGRVGGYSIVFSA
jgi:hypothetical protein